MFLVGGKRGTEEVVPERPADLARAWQRRGARRLHVVDLDGAMGSGDNRDLVAKILRAVTIPVQVGGGLRSEDAIREVLHLGAAHAIVGTRAVLDPAWLRSMTTRFPSRLILALDRDPRGVLVDGWQRASSSDPRSLVDLANGLPLEGVLFTDVAVEGRLRGVAAGTDDLVRRCTKPRIAAGGATTLKDLRLLRDEGFDHVVVGKALLAGTLDFDEAQEILP